MGVEPHVLRYWEREFRSIRPSKSSKGQRVYSRRDVETLLRVRELLYGQGFTIAGARRRLREGDPSEAPLPAAETRADMAAQVTPTEAPGTPARHLSPRVRGELESLKLEVEALLAGFP